MAENQLDEIEENVRILSLNEPPTEDDTAQSTPPHLNQYKTTRGPFIEACHCNIYEKLLKEDLVIKEATTGYLEPSTGQESGNFVTYVIEFEDTLTRRRYSDFELLAAHLSRTYTYQVIPPIPEKETLTSIISGYTGLKDRHDPFLIQHRIRLFQSFLMNLRDHPVLKGDHYFHRLISSEFSGVSWSEGITSVSVGDFAVDHPQHEQIITKGKIPDPLVLRLEEMTQKYREGIRSIERGQCKLLKRLKDESNLLGELGASFNGFSLELTNKNVDSSNTDTDSDDHNHNQNHDQNCLSITDQNPSITSKDQNLSFKSQLEMIGQSSDSEVIHLHSLIRHHELLRDRLQEIILYCGRILKSLTNLTQRRATLEEFHDQINGKKNALMQMETNSRADEESSEKLVKLKKTIDELEKSKKTKFSEMSEFSNMLLNDIDRTFGYFGRTWKESLKALAECQSHWHEEAINSWKF